MRPVKILRDTDPGIDDAMALLMLARDARAQLVGISTVFGNAPVQRTSANALALCERFGIDAPVAAGAALPLSRIERDYPLHIHGRDGIGDVGLKPARDRCLDPRGASAFISRLARQYSGELVLVAVGPLTNLALALADDPGIVRHVQRVVLMGGAFGTLGHRGNITPHAEANIHCDVQAARAVFAAAWPVTVVGLDVTHQVLMDNTYLDRIGEHGGDAGRFVRDITRPYERFYAQRTGGGIYAHDASAVVCALAPERFEQRRGTVSVHPDGAEFGRTLLHDGDAHRVCVAVDAPALRADFAACFVR